MGTSVRRAARCVSSLPLFVAAAALGQGGAARSPRSLRSPSAPAAPCGDEAYAEFRRSLGLEVSPSKNATADEHRRELFRRRCEAVLEQNARAGARWKASLNHFADRTDDELRTYLGYKRSSSGHHRHGSLSFISVATGKTSADVKKLPDEVDWRNGLISAEYIRHQGNCGSCWAIASVGALEMHAELRNESATPLSMDHLVRCVPNPERCGGAGGCDGATAELAFRFVKEHGLGVEPRLGVPPELGSCELREGRRAIISGFVRLPTNRAEPLIEALATHGPVVVSVAASDWFPYESGIYDYCSRNAIVNHAALAVGYQKRAYIIRNSWGRSWGEFGHIRLLRHRKQLDNYCGVDTKPLEGVGCMNGPSEVKVCGMCGVLSDASYPVDVRLLGGAAPTAREPRKSSRPPADLAPDDAFSR